MSVQAGGHPRFDGCSRWTPGGEEGEIVIGGSAYTQAGAATTSVVVERSSSVLNRGTGILAQNTGAYVTLTDSSALWNATGLTTVTRGGIFSFGNNRIAGNGDGASLTPGISTLK